MIGYRKFIYQIFALVAGLALTYLNKDAILDQFTQGGTAIINAVFDLLVLFGIPQGGAQLYNRANIKAKQVMASNGNGAAVTQTVGTVGSIVPPSDAIAASLGAPLDVEKMLEEAERNRGRLFNYQFASTKETGLYYAFRDLGNATATASLQHSLEFFDKLIELTQASWLAETEKAIGKGKGFSWDDKDLEANLAKGFPPGCHAANGSYSWARKFSLSGLYRGIQSDMVASGWLEILAQQPYIDIVKVFGANCTLYRVGVNAREVVENPKRK